MKDLGGTPTPWATRELGLTIEHRSSDVGRRTDDLVIPGLRKNPKRAHLLVSTVLGKHIPVTPTVALEAGQQLAALCGDLTDAVVIGFAETATGLGHMVAHALGAHLYLHSTRRRVPGIDVFGSFEEGHSHATDHMLLPTSAAVMDGNGPMVLVDDEISTGTTALRAIRELHRRAPRSRYIVASLVDMRTDEHLAEQRAVAAELGVTIDAVSLAQGRVVIPDGLIESVAALPNASAPAVADTPGSVDRIDLRWPEGVPDGGRHGFLKSDEPAFDHALTSIATELQQKLDPERPVIVIGTEEFMYLPLRIAEYLESAGRQTLFQTTTRSPAYVVDEPGYPLRRGFEFAASEPGEDASRHLYNADLAGAQLLLVVDEPADTDALQGAVSALTRSGADVAVIAVTGANPATLTSERENQ